VVGGRPKAFGNLLGIEAKAGAPARSETPGAQLLGVVVDPAPADAPPPGYLLGGDPLTAIVGSAVAADQLDDTPSKDLDRLGRDSHLRGDVVGGANDLRQLLFRPRPARDPYALGIPGVYLCSASTPPGAGAHGMCGFNAANSALRELRRR